MIRYVKADDLDRLATIEAASYPKAEAASKESIKKRMKRLSNIFRIPSSHQIIIIIYY